MLIRLAQHRLPAIYPLRLFCDAGGPISYGIDLYQLLQQAVSYGSLTSRGANPADLAGADQI
jgi:putative ABC transport system substrate-binding protein